MIELVIQNVLDAEAQAAKIKSTAEENAQKIAARAETDALSAKAAADAEAKVLRAQILDSANRDASDRYNDGIKKVEKELSDYKKSKEELAEKLADELVAGVLNGCC